MSAKSFEGRIVLITGASRGIGAALARQLAAQGAQTILLARGVDGLEQVDDAIRSAGGLAPVLVPMDLRDGERIDTLGPALYERFGRLDILVGNAAQLGELGPLGHQNPKQWQSVMQVNLDANWRLIRILDPLLRLSDAGRAVFVTSGVAQMNLAYWGPYAVSKSALEQLVLTYATETRDTNLRVNLFDPGVVATQMRASAFPGEDPTKLREPGQVAQAMQPLLDANCTAHGTRLVMQSRA